MREFDLVIRGGTIVDGSGSARYRGDVGIKDGRIVAVGDVAGDSSETIDATGRIVAPGFIDVHTHYERVFWDPALSPSCFHGVTTILGGFCGFSIAPMAPHAADYLMKMLARVEGMPLETLQMAVPWSWEGFGEFLDSFEGKVGLNAGFFAGHSAIGRVVMGERAVGETCTPEELEQMKALLHQSLEQGALGFSSTISASHNDGDGNPVPSRWADHSEIVELSRIVSEHEGTRLEFLPDTDFGPGIPELITDMSIAGNRPVNWNVLIVFGANAEERASRQLAVSDYARSRGGEVIALTVPSTPDPFVNFKSGFGLDVNPGMWREIFKWPLDERIERLRNDSALRQQLKDDVAGDGSSGVMAHLARIGEFRIASVIAEKNKPPEGRYIGDIAAEQGRDPLDVMLDIALDDDLTACFIPNFAKNDHDSYVLRGKLWHDDRTLIGASDAGAHMDMIDTFAFSTTVLQEGVRNHGVVSLEQAVYQMTDRPARYMGLIDRGLLKAGYHADIVVFDEASVGSGPTYPRYDVPGDQFRLYAEAEGIDHVIVNGVEIVRKGEHTGKLPGTVLRSGRDTRTVPLDVMREGTAARADADLVPQK